VSETWQEAAADVLGTYPWVSNYIYSLHGLAYDNRCTCDFNPCTYNLWLITCDYDPHIHTYREILEAGEIQVLVVAQEHRYAKDRLIRVEQSY